MTRLLLPFAVLLAAVVLALAFRYTPADQMILSGATVEMMVIDRWTGTARIIAVPRR